MFGWVLMSGLKDGYFVGRWGDRTYRKREPIAYWLGVIFVAEIFVLVAWSLDRIRGSHHHYRYPNKPGTLTVAVHSGTIKRKLLPL